MPIEAQRLRVLQFASVINRHDFIDTIIGHVDKRRFAPMACTFLTATNIQATEYEGVIPSFSLDVKNRRGYPAAVFPSCVNPPETKRRHPACPSLR